LLEKKQASGTTSAQTDSPKGEAHDKGISGSVVNDPPASYHQANENDNKNWPDKTNLTDDGFGIDSKPGNAQNEDDLPF
jgi:hypothetical protein